MRVRWPQFRQVITMWGSLRFCVRTRLFMPSKIKDLHFLQIWRLYFAGKRILAAMAIFLAVYT